MNKKYFILLILIWLLPSLFLTYIRYVDPFLWGLLSDAAAGLYRGYLSELSVESSTYIVIIYLLSIIPGISPEQLSYLPIGGFIVPLCYFIISKRLLKSKILAIFLAIYVSYDFSLYSGHYNVLAYAWTRSLFLSFLFLFWLYIQTKKWFYIIPLFLIFLTIHHLHPTSTFWIIMLTALTNLLIILVKKLGSINIGLKPITNLVLSFLGIYLVFNQLLYNVFIKKVISPEFDMISEKFISTIQVFFGFTSMGTERYLLTERYVSPNSQLPQIMGYAIFFRTFLILITLVVALIFWLRRSSKGMFFNIDNGTVLVVSLFLIGIAHTLAYAVFGHVSLRFITLIYPIVAVIALQKINARKSIQVGFLVILMLLAFLQTTSFIIENYNKPDDSIYEVRSTFRWLYNARETQNPLILSDFQTSQVLLYYFKARGSSFIQRFYDSEMYERVVNMLHKNTGLTSINYIIINIKLKSTPSVGWKAYEPLSKYIGEINNNVNIHKIYEDGTNQIFNTWKI